MASQNLREYACLLRDIYADTESILGKRRGFAYHDGLVRDGTEYGPSAVDRTGSQRLHQEYRTQPKQCFYNAQSIALADPHLSYCEGLGFSLIPCEHAWLITEEGRVLDPTWPVWSGRKVDVGCEAYLGLVIPKHVIEETWMATGLAVPLLMYWLEQRDTR